jgi:SAM-dependent methyltransferase
MPYHIYLPWMRQNVFSKIKNPNILEIGVDVGQTLLPILNTYTLARAPFRYTGLDIRKDENLSGILTQCLLLEGQNIKYEQVNSLEWLPKCQEKFDLILIDGDHNYFTVIEELKHMDRLLAPNGVIICDDYQWSKWSKEDLYYATRDSHEGLTEATEPVETEKHGVRAAIDDFLSENDGWKMSLPLNSEACLIQRKKT